MSIDPGNKSLQLRLITPEWYRWFAVLMMWTAHLVYFLIYSSVGVLGPILKVVLKLSNTEFGVLCGAIGVGTTAAQIPGGMWCDRLGVRKLMTLAFVVMAVCALIFSMSRGLAFPCFTLFFLGLGVGCNQIGAAKAIIDWFPHTGRATAMGIKQTGINAGGIAGSLALPLLLGLCDWRSLFKLMAGLAFLFALFFFVVYRDAQKTSHGFSNYPVRFREAVICLKQVRFLLVTLAGIFLMVVQFSFSSYLVLYLTQSLHYSLETSGMILASSFAVGAAARVGWGAASDYIFKERETTLISIGIVGASACIGLALLSSASRVWVLYLLSVLFGISLLGWNGVWITLAGEVARENSTGLHLGLSFFFANLGMLFGPPLFGILIDFFHSFFLPWLFLAFCMGMVSIALLFESRTSSRRSKLEEAS